MSPEQLNKLQKLRAVFENGYATTSDIKELSELLTLINHRVNDDDLETTQLTIQSAIQF
ncbi:MAG: hypothetical protein MJK12_15810 [Colwellia sp.]|nr:hypothetical protein [Colwellia sp.]